VPIPALPGAIATTLEGINSARELATADPATLNPVERGVRSGIRQYCRGVASLPFGAYSFGPAHGAAGSYICEPYYDEQGDDPGGPPTPPFTGGQCSIAYNVEISGPSTLFPGPGEAEITNRVGPIQGLSWVPTGSNPNARTARLQTATGTFGISGGQASVHVDEVGSWSITSVTPTNGGADTCGNPPSTPNPPVVGNPYGWGSPEIDPGTGITVTTPQPPSGPGGITVNVGDLPITVGFGGESSPSSQRPEDGELSEGSPITGGGGGIGEDFPPPPDGSEWVGVRWQIDNVHPGSGMIAGTFGDEIFPEVVGNLRLKVASGQDSPTFLTSTLDIKSLRGSLFRPVAGLIVLGTASNKRYSEWGLTLTPIAGKVETVES
jgi:hypothetical protein